MNKFKAGDWVIYHYDGPDPQPSWSRRLTENKLLYVSSLPVSTADTYYLLFREEDDRVVNSPSYHNSMWSPPLGYFVHAKNILPSYSQKIEELL